MLIPFSLRRPIALTGAIAVALALLAPLAPARAATIDYSLVLPTAATANPLATSTSGAGAAVAENVTGTIVNVRRSPWGAANSTLDENAATSVYSALYNASGTTPVSASFDFGGIFNRLSLVWGTPGPTNTLTLLLGGVAQVTMTGADAATLVTSAGGNRSVLLTLTGWKFDEMVIGADHRALEFANLQAAVVPVPAAGLMLVTALGGLALMRRRKAA
jgi:hypothetical protein